MSSADFMMDGGDAGPRKEGEYQGAIQTSTTHYFRKGALADYCLNLHSMESQVPNAVWLRAPVDQKTLDLMLKGVRDLS